MDVSKAVKGFKKSFDKLAGEEKEIFLVTHIGIDDDAVGSMLAAYFYLKDYLKAGGRIKMLATGNKPERYSLIKGYDQVMFVKDIEEYVKKKFVVFLDGSSWHRFSWKEKPVLKKSVCVDHHASEGDEYDLSLIMPDFTSTAELLYHALFKKEKKLSVEVCEALLLGILGDTGNFSYVKKRGSSVFLVAERLVREGNINVQGFQARYDYIQRNSFKAFKKITGNAELKKVGGWPSFVFSYLENEDAGDYNSVNEAAHMFTAYTRKIKGVQWGFVITPRKDSCSVSLRSLPGTVNVRKIAEAFGGGGHDLAAGCGIKEKDCVAAKNIFLEWLEENDYEGYRD